MRYSCAMMSPSVTLPIAEEEADVDGAERDGVEQEGGSVKSDSSTETAPHYILR